MGPAVPSRDGPGWGSRPHPRALHSDPSSWCLGFPCWLLLTVFLHVRVLSLGQKACSAKAKCSGSDQKRRGRGEDSSCSRLFQLNHNSTASTPAPDLRGPSHLQGRWTRAQTRSLENSLHTMGAPVERESQRGNTVQGTRAGGSRREATGRCLPLPDSITSLPPSSSLSEDQPSSPTGRRMGAPPRRPAALPRVLGRLAPAT